MDLIGAVLRAYSQILFARDPWVGALLFAATLFAPQAALSGLLAVLLSSGIAALLRLPKAAIGDGLFGYNALLAGLAAGSWLPLGARWSAVLLVSTLVTTGLTAALRDAGSRSGLPALTIPFIAVSALLASAFAALGIPIGVDLDRSLVSEAPIGAALSSLGSLLFVPRADAGLLVLLALLRWSRIGTTLWAMGATLGLLIARDPSIPDTLTHALVLNLGLTAIALGGVWFVPSPSSFLLALVGAGCAAFVTIGLAPVAEGLGVPLLISPFNAVVLSSLLALRQRAEDRAPKSVDFLPGSPEENLQYYRRRLSRFGARYGVRLRAPVRGTWVVTQSEGDGPTHQGPWHSAIDLEVQDDDGRLFTGAGERREDYLCWHLPVLACADGTVVEVIDDIRDNKPGEVDLDDNWGNLVVLWHAQGLYSLVAHLSHKSVRVSAGARVRRGDVLGLCGSSGRSPRPHLHFQLQAAAVPGAPTLPVELHDVVSVGERPRLLGAWTPRTRERLRNLDLPEPHRGATGWIPSRPFGLRIEGEGRDERVQIVPEIDLYGRRALVCGAGRAYLSFEEDLLTVLDTLAPRSSALHLLQAAFPRLPLHIDASTPEWCDHLPSRWIVPPLLRPLLDFIEPFRAPVGLEMCYRARAEGDVVIVEGRSTRAWRGRPELETDARFHRATGLLEAARTLRGSTLRVTRSDEGRTT